MKYSLLTLTIATQLAAGAAFAQTTTDDINESISQTNAPDLQPVAYGGDWPETLVTPLFDDDGLTLRSADEITAAWGDLTPQDQDFIRRDCADVVQLTEAEMLSDDPGRMSEDAATSTTPGDGSAGLGTGANTTGTFAGEAPADAVTGADVPGTTGAPGETGTTGDTSVTPFTSDTVPEEDGPAMDEDMETTQDDVPSTISLSIAQMEDICVATQNF
ncbi:hypothetical protein [Yoonia sp.]|uniref:hypothetical protein n=1 Tax=Yoonia sp. TaxID=2212373 RepID=UPI00391B8D9C